MPIHYEIYYDVSANDFECDLWPNTSSSIEVHLVQDDTVKHPTTADEYVEEIVVYYSQTDPPPPSPPEWDDTRSFVLRLQGKQRYALEDPPSSFVLPEGKNGSSATASHGNDYYEWSFSFPADVCTTVFEFDSGTGPPTKLKVKIKKQTGSFSC